MPYSSDSGKRFTERAITRLSVELGEKFFTNKRILDIGAGSGTYSNLYSSVHLPRSKFTWEAVEIWEPYVEKFSLRDKYDSVHITGAIEFFKTSQECYDLVFMGDVVEHMTKEQAVEMVEMAKQVCRLIIISIPIVHYPQDEYEGNPYEAHVKDDWSVQEVLETFTDVVSYGVESEIGVFCIAGNIGKIDLADVLGPRIGVYAIGKDEMKFARRFFENIIGADHAVICDTGSTDGTYELLVDAAKDCDRFDIHRISVQPFRFDDARNTAMMLLRTDLDLCISIDFDELLPDAWHAYLGEKIVEELHTQGYVTDRWNHRFSTIWDWEGEGKSASEHWHERIHTRHNYLWKLPVHEVLVKQGSPENIKWLSDFTMVQKPDTSKNRSSYLPMLEKSLKEDNTRWKTWSFYASDLANAGRVNEAINAMKNALLCPDVDKAFVHHSLSRYNQMQGYNREAVEEAVNAAMAAPSVREYKVYVAQLYLDLGDKMAARPWLSMANGMKERTYGYEYNPACWGEAFEQLVERCKED